ncbi:replication-associated recombination protein A [Oceanospirillum linum]|uniref:Replication-associated recombination protein A n=1 Tax=Oceanospirillum linum TaxID=966 RepID=A0A1T1HDM3_OCELI|nr:replication-associated recombination protein A [Oceanospirillum linum]OOV87817.1 recombination factor protein RarA [Oceanospirillum linum]SEG11346.1 Recombination protein MgsA [Oleiphilus messinensis]SMP09201.1 Recombination protein MgsA [Oceanospirillum linum]
MDLFAEQPKWQPLAARMRPKTLDEYSGQQHLLALDKPLRQAIERDQLHSMIFWGPPGVGKTTLARLIAELTKARFESISAVLSGVKEIRAAVERAQQTRAHGGKTLLFVDEVHRFNKSQQDAFLPFVEDGTFIFVGATTENPSFELNNALLSRARVYVLRSLESEDLMQVLHHAITDVERGLGKQKLQVDDLHLELLAKAADGDARRALNLLEVASDLAEDTPDGRRIDGQVMSEVLAESTRRMDKGGDLFYEQISALHKSVRGSAPDAALYWFCRMLDGGCDPLYIARRVVRMASEEIGNADPRALQLCLNAWDVQERLGSPEGELAVAQAILYLASAPKSNAAYKAYNKARAHVVETGHYDVPVHLRNAPTKLMKEMGFGQEYRYAHDEPDAYAAGENYFPEELAETRYYYPENRGLEQKIAQKMQWLAQKDAESELKRYPGK